MKLICSRYTAYTKGTILGYRLDMAVRRAILVAAAATMLLLPGLAGAQATSGQPAEPAPKFRSAVDLVSVAAVVRDQARPVRVRPGPRGLRGRRGRGASADRRIRGGTERADQARGAVRHQRQHAGGIEGRGRAAGGTPPVQCAEGRRSSGAVLVRHAARQGARLHDGLHDARVRDVESRSALRTDVAV